MLSKVALLSFALATLFVAEAIYWGVRYRAERKRQELRRRLRLIGEEAHPAAMFRSGGFAKSPRLERAMSSMSLFGPVAKLLSQTDLGWTVAGLLGGSLALGVSGILLGVAVHSVVAGAIAFAALSALPSAIALRARDRRSAAISRQLPETLDLVARSLRAGHALPESLKLAAHELPMPIAAELARTYEEQMLGQPIDRAILNMVERVPSNLDVRIFAAAVVVNQKTGGNIAEVLDRIASTIRERYKFYGQLRAYTAEGKLSGLLLGALPWLVVTLLWILRRDYLLELGSDSLGRTIAAIGALLWLTGTLWIRRIVRVDV